MRYIVAYTLKHNDIPDTFRDEYMVVDDEDTFNQDALSLAEAYYDDVLSEKDIEEGWHVWTASISTIIKSTDY
jgi:hypothetical protein